MQLITPELLGPIVEMAHGFGRPVLGQIWHTDAEQAAKIGIDQLDNTSRIFASRDYPKERLLSYRSVPERLALLDRDQPELNLTTQCDLLCLNRTSLYYQPALPSAAQPS